ncbi:MAG: anaerobic ribonucleoside-triphosphate reductase activating protein [Kiritimatiellae bacterium]|nr:anaerobic ribonucleoside-triphosphate reductase activating protein [Kiritimatiellia bacterium]
MTIGGFVPLSLCDFPGRVAAVIFTVGCPFRCPWCHNGHLLRFSGETPLLDESEVWTKLMAHRGKIGGVVVSGGEPALQPDLPDFLARLKAEGFAVKLDTNGAYPEVLERLFAEMRLDFVAMDIKAPWEKYPLLTGLPDCPVDRIKASVELIARSGVAHQFRTTRVDPLLDAADYAAILRQIPPGSPHVWQTFRPEYSLDPALRAE